MQLKQFLFFNALLYSSCALAFKTKVSFILTETNASPNEEATSSSSTNLLFTNKNDFVKESEIMCDFELYASLIYLQYMERLEQSEKHTFTVHFLFGESIDKEDYGKKNNTSLQNIKDAINYSLQIKNIVYPQHKINSMGYRIFQRIIDLHEFYNENISLNDVILSEWENSRFWLHIISCELDNTDLNIRDYYIKIKDRIGRDSVIKDNLNDDRINNIACRIMQFISDLVFIDSSAYSDLVKI
ncbi:hypothetical protein HEP_00507700 [Hepatocystis sp. ex Piliocolobus tephrosceles]|nr:hypothetical protein HEP_00507700 [Hepatocystis sp. ex Piliocolobus tephrosceles]